MTGRLRELGAFFFSDDEWFQAWPRLSRQSFHLLSPNNQQKSNPIVMLIQYYVWV